MHGLGWILVSCAAISVTLAGFCSEQYNCGRSCSWFVCRTKYCNRNVCCAGWRGTNCDEDIDECAAETHLCEHTCTNTDGSYTCSCRENYLLQADKRSCDGHWRTRTFSCYKPSSYQSCTTVFWWWRSCKTKTRNVLSTCSERVCRDGWTGDDCATRDSIQVD